MLAISSFSGHLRASAGFRDQHDEDQISSTETAERGTTIVLASRHGSASMFWSSDKRCGSKLGRFWHAVARVFNHCNIGNRKLKIILLYYNALGRVPSRANVGSGQGRMRRAEAGHYHHIAGPSVDFCGYWQRCCH
jgi:hypothetical protein